jgi:hypothetical protein
MAPLGHKSRCCGWKWVHKWCERCSRPPRTLLHRTGGRFNSASGAKAPRTPTALAATTDVDSAEHKQLPKRQFSIKQTTMMPIWQLLLTYLAAYYPLLCICLPPAHSCPCPLFPPHPPEPSPSPTTQACEALPEWVTGPLLCPIRTRAPFRGHTNKSQSTAKWGEVGKYSFYLWCSSKVVLCKAPLMSECVT